MTERFQGGSVDKHSPQTIGEVELCFALRNDAGILTTVRVVVDTNVLVAALRSRRGASFQLLRLLGTSWFQPIVSPPLCLEYEDVLRRSDLLSGYTPQDIGDFLDYVLSQGLECSIYFLWRPHLSDPKDDLVLELALAGSAEFIVTHNVRDFQGAEELGVRVVTPAEFLGMIPAP